MRATSPDSPDDDAAYRKVVEEGIGKEMNVVNARHSEHIREIREYIMRVDLQTTTDSMDVRYIVHPDRTVQYEFINPSFVASFEEPVANRSQSIDIVRGSFKLKPPLVPSYFKQLNPFEKPVTF